MLASGSESLRIGEKNGILGGLNADIGLILFFGFCQSYKNRSTTTKPIIPILQYSVVYYIHGKANSTCLVALPEYDELVMVGCKDDYRRLPA
jgi:hypothetical protein